MAGTRFNLNLLRGDLISQLSLSGLGGLRIPFPPPPPPPPPSGQVQIEPGPGSVAFKLNGRVAWLVDVKQFAGAPALTFTPQGQGGRIELKNALLPGTSLPADFVLDVHPPNPFGTPFQLNLTLGGFAGQGLLERWLNGQDRLQSNVALNNAVCPLKAGSDISLAGDASATFIPNWQLDLSGANIANIDGLGGDLAADRFLIRLMEPGEPSVSANPKTKRTTLAMIKQPHQWPLVPDTLSIAIGDIDVPADPDGLFDRILVETGQDGADDAARVLVADALPPHRLNLAVGGGITDLDGAPARLPLTQIRYAIAFDPTPSLGLGDQSSLTARVSETPQWIAVEGFALQLGAGAIEVDGHDGAVTSFRCEPALLQAAAPFTPDVVTKPLAIAPGTHLGLVAAPGATPGWGLLVPPDSTPPRLSIPDFAVTVLRPEDLLSLDFLFFNLALEAGGSADPSRLARMDANADAILVARFNAPQNIAEQAFFELYPPDGKNSLTGEDPLPPGQLAARAAGPSQLAFKLAAGVDTLPYSLASLLDWLNLDPSLSSVAIPPDPDGPMILRPRIHQPTATETAIEAPWRVFLSPNPAGTWAHSPDAVTENSRTELWHTRLALKSTNADGNVTIDETGVPPIRAIWSPDFQEGNPPPHFDHPDPLHPDAFRTSLDPNDRDQIVALSSDFTIPGYQVRSIESHQLMLSSLGAWLDVRGNWNPPQGGILFPGPSFSLEEWRHKASMGRDTYVRVVTAGHLVPYGHRASLVKVTERKFQKSPAGNTVAYLRQRFFIIVREPQKDYSFLGFVAPTQGRDLPFQTIRFTTIVTPNLDPPTLVGGKYVFVPSVNLQPFPFHLVARDRDQQQQQAAEFTTPAIFVELGGDLAGAVNSFNLRADRKRDMAGQKIGYAPSAKTGDTTLQTAALSFKGVNLAAANPPCYPAMESADAVIPSVRQLVGKADPVHIEMFDDYVANGLKPGGVFVKVPGGLPVSFSGDKSGGVATPNLNIIGLSRQFGAVSGAPADLPASLGDFAGGRFDPQKFFAGIGDAKLLGFIKLSDIVQVVADISGVDAQKALQTVTQQLPDAIVTTMTWHPALQQDFPSPSAPIKISFTDPATALELDVTSKVSLKGGAPEATVHGKMQQFKLELFNVISLAFDSLEFTAPAGKKLDVSANLAKKGIQFEGDLSFLSQLQDLIPSDGFSDPPSLDVSPSGVTVGFSLPIPAVGVGVFSLENIRLSAALTLPFLSGPIIFRFAFSEREHPFLLTVSLLGGGGFFAISLGPHGVELLEASIEFGANCTIGLVVASANVHIMAGVYLRLDPVSDTSSLTGYLRAGGSACVLGLITISVEFYLGFTYYFGSPCKIAGEASVTVQVDVLFFSASVSLSLRREFEDPEISFADLIRPSDWDDYADAFAA